MSTSVSSVVSHFPSAENGFTTTLASTIASGATTVPLNSVSGYTNGEIAVFVVDPSDASKKQTFTGTIDTAGVQVTSVIWTAGTNQTHTGGATVVDYATATHISMMTKGLLVAHNQDGTHKTSMVMVTPKVDVIGESTSAAGVTIDGLLIKDGTPIFDGWMIGNDTWTYASATTFTIAGVDRTARFPVGTKLKLTQTTAKYFYVVSSSFSTDTTVTVTGGTDYTLANAAITSPFYSYMSSPQGFPQWFAYTATWTGYTGTPVYVSRFKVEGRTCYVAHNYVSTGTSNATTLTFTLPITAVTIASRTWATYFGPCADNSAATGASIVISSAGTIANCYKGNAGSGSTWTNANLKWVDGIAVYEI